jgi:hypothetical protein
MKKRVTISEKSGCWLSVHKKRITKRKDLTERKREGIYEREKPLKIKVMRRQ